MRPADQTFCSQEAEPSCGASLTCMAKSVVRHPTVTSAGAVQSAESIFTCLMLLGVIQPPPSSSWSWSSGSSSSSPSPDCSDVSRLLSASCKQKTRSGPAAVGQSPSLIDVSGNDQQLQQVVVDGGKRRPPEQEAAELVAVRRRLCVRLFLLRILRQTHVCESFILTEERRARPCGVNLVYLSLIDLSSNGSQSGGPKSEISCVLAVNSPADAAARCRAAAEALSRTGSC